MCELPPELVTKPLALIGLTGLDIANPVHRSIWDAFSNNRRLESSAIQFKSLSPTHEFPTVKPKRNSYEYYRPKGILKRNWMNKYLNEIPAVVVVFYNLDWNDPQWNEKKMECASKVQSVRNALDGRTTKIAVVLIQHCTQPPPGSEDTIATERATAVCGACELSPKLLYVLPHGNHLLGYISRLESALYDLAQNFYHHEYRIVKGHRDQLNKTMQKNAYKHLSVRHQFKMAFLNELRQDQNLAQKHYTQAYNHLLEIPITDTNVMEITTIACFINYKLCKVMFNLNVPKDAISQFRLHTDRFKIWTGPKELIFEHHAWMCSQFSIFAELFDDAIRQGLPGVQTQHPGYYFQSAAHHAGLRQAACKELCQNVTSYPDPDPLAGEEKLEFYGQRPWCPGKFSAEPIDPIKKALAIQALQYKEKYTVNHSNIIIALLGNAISQFKIYRCPRMRRVLVVQMAEEYYNSKDYEKVLTLLMHMLWDYHGERWPVLLTNILKNALRAAYLCASVQDYIALAFEALGPSTTFSEDYKDAVYNNIINILHKKPPTPESDLPDDVRYSAVEDWVVELNKSEPIVFTIDDNNMSSFIEVKARFLQPKYTVNSMVTVEVIIRNSYSNSVEFSKVSITVNSPGYNSEFVVADAEHNNLIFHGKEMRKFPYQFEAPQQNESSEIRITTISLYMSSDKTCCIILRFSAVRRDTNFLSRLYPEIQQLRGEFETIQSLVSAEIKQEESTLSISTESNNPALLGEWLPINISIVTNEKISSAFLNVSLVSDGANEESTELSLTMNNTQSVISIPIDNLEKDCVTHQTVYLRAHKVGDQDIHIKVEYTRSKQIKGSKELTYSLSVRKPFEVSTLFYTTLFEPLTKGFINEPFIMMPHIVCMSPWPINIINTSIKLGNLIERENGNKEVSVLSGITLSANETGTDVYCLIPKANNELFVPISTGVYTIKWKRANDDNALETSSSVTLAPLKVEDALICLEAKIPAHGWVRTPLLISYFIKNHSDNIITLRLTMEASDAFMFAGQKQIDIYILPKNERKVEWILRPLVAGFVQLPSLSLTVPADEEHKLSKARLSELVERSIPSHIYILPTSQNLGE